MSNNDRTRSRTIAIAAAVQRDYAAVAGKVVLLKGVCAFAKSDSGDAVDRELDPPVEFRISSTACSSDLNRVCDQWVDPVYDCDPVNPGDPQLAGLESFSCYGTSYHRFSDETEPGDIYTGPLKMKKFRVPYTVKIMDTLVISAATPEEALTKAKLVSLDKLVQDVQFGGLEFGAPEEQP